MIQRFRFLFATLMLVPALGYAQTTVPSTATSGTDWRAKCLKVYATNCKQHPGASGDPLMDADVVQRCVMLGWDPPITCRKNNGVSEGIRSSGANGFVYGSVAGPDQSAGAVGARPTMDTATIRRAMSTKPWPATTVSGAAAVSNCTLPSGFNICDLDKALGQPSTPAVNPNAGNSLCPAKDDTTGIYGAKTAINITSPANLSLTCGGAMPLSSYQITLNKTPNAVASTEYNAFYLWVYQQSGTNGPYNLTANAIKLPTVLCNASSTKSVDLTAPIAQMITFSSGKTQELAIRLTPRSQIDPSIVPPMVPYYNPTDPEKYLVIPLKNGVPDPAKLPKDPTNLADLVNLPPAQELATVLNGCSLDTDYYKTLDQIKMDEDLTIESANNLGCEGSADECKTAKPAPVTDENCDIVNFTPPGSSCKGKTQYAILDRPNLVFPPGAKPTITPLTGRSAVLISSLDGSKIFAQADTILDIGATAPPFTLNEGGTYNLSDGTHLYMYAPVTINAASKTVTLTAGGQHIAADGSVIKVFGSNTTFQTTDKVITVSANRSINIPAGYEVPSMATIPGPPVVTPYVQVPANQ